MDFCTRRQGDAVENDYDKEVYNGDIGYIDDINPDNGDYGDWSEPRAIKFKVALPKPDPTGEMLWRAGMMD